jgi:hypothetical protein
MSSTESDPETGLPEDPDIDRQQDAMKDQLRKDVASWSASRSNEASGMATRVPSAAKPSAPAPAARAPRQKAKAVAVAEPVPAEKKPFKMSYDGTTDRDYIATRIKLGAR